MSDLPGLTSTERAAYLDRIGLAADEPGAEAGPPLLARLQLAHLLAVPFENLDIHLGRGISLEPDRVLAKVVGRRRGGYCYELNSAFARLLTSFGFDVTLVSVRIPFDRGGLSPEFDHLALLVAGGALERTHLVDVGFGDAFTVPLPLHSGAEVADRDRRVRLVDHGDHWDYEEDRGDGWRLWYRFTVTPQHLGAFEGMNRFQQSSPDSHFTGRRICTRLTPAGRLTLSDRRLIETEVGGDRSERDLDDAEIEATLDARFGIDVPPAPSLAGLPATGVAVRPATLATNGADGRPRLTVVHPSIEHDRIRLTIDERGPAANDLRLDGRCTVLLADPEAPDRVVEVRSWASVASSGRGGDGAGGLAVVLRPQRIEGPSVA